MILAILIRRVETRKTGSEYVFPIVDEAEHVREISWRQVSKKQNGSARQFCLKNKSKPNHTCGDARGNGLRRSRLRIKILEKDTPNKGFSQPLALNNFAVQHKITANYLLWYLSHEPIASFLVEHTTGSVFLRVPQKILHELPIPLPTRVTRIKSASEFSVVKTSDDFSRLIDGLHNDYLLNIKNDRFRTAAVLAGAISEVILYQLLIEIGVNPSLLKDDRNLGFNKLLDYVRVLRIDETPDFPISQLVELQRNRNHAIHAGLLVNKQREIGASDLECFNPVIKYFGL